MINIKKLQVMMRSLASNPAYGWLYSGSHNLSSCTYIYYTVLNFIAAWGRLASGGLQINNYELGVLFVSPKSAEAITADQSLDKFSLPFNRNPERYAANEKPWLIPKRPKVLQAVMCF
jgi:hypothetical protein